MWLVLGVPCMRLENLAPGSVVVRDVDWSAEAMPPERTGARKGCRNPCATRGGARHRHGYAALQALQALP